jgi:hypothetical protein
MDYSLKSTNDYIKRIIEKNEDKKIQLKINDLIKEKEISIKENEKEINKLDEKSSTILKPLQYLPILIFLSFSSYILFKK